MRQQSPIKIGPPSLIGIARTVTQFLLILFICSAAQTALAAGEVFADGFESDESSTENSQPVADAGADQDGYVGDTIELDGMGSSDADGDDLIYDWTLTTIPDGSLAEIINSTSAVASFVVDVAGMYIAQLIVSDSALNSDPDTVNVMTAIPVILPPDPADVATPIAVGIATNIGAATEFLYSGTDPIQTGVAPDTIEALRVAVLRGSVRTRSDEPLTGVTIDILNHPEFGQTLSRADGVFDMAVNGGDFVTVRYAKDGYLPVQRQLKLPWLDYAIVDDVVMIPVDAKVTTIDLTSPAPMQVAAGSLVTDADGSRQAVLMISQGTSAEIFLPDGSTQAVTTLNLRATEYTVGDNGPEAMPGTLPPTSGYTYAVELSADEANGVKVDGRDVVFSQAISFYVDNFLGFDVGTVVPVGYYNGGTGAWLPSDNGLVIEIVAISAGMADVDVDGDGVADTGASLSGLGITDAERTELVNRYEVGKSLWRMRTTHLSTWDGNWPYGPPGTATAPPRPPVGRPDSERDNSDPCEEEGSILECQNQVLGERLPLTGTDLTLNYRSSRVLGSGNSNELSIQLTRSAPIPDLVGVSLIIEVGGRQWIENFGPEPDQSYDFLWDGLDAYGRELEGAQKVEFRIGYIYDAVYYGSIFDLREETSAFAALGASFTKVKSRQQIIYWAEGESFLGRFKSTAQGLNGWFLNVHHSYDPMTRTLYFGDGTVRSSVSIQSVTNSFAGGGACCLVRFGVPATDSYMRDIKDIIIAPNGDTYISDQGARIYRVDQDGILTKIAGVTVTTGYSGDGGPANAAYIDAGSMGLAPDGSIYFVQTNWNIVRKIDPDGIISTIAGDGSYASSGDGGPALAAQLASPWDIAIAADGSIFFSEANFIRRIDPAGGISTYAGLLTGSTDERILATNARILPKQIALGSDGALFFYDDATRKVRRIGPDGIIESFAGGGFNTSDFIPALDAKVRARDLVVDAEGNLLIADEQAFRVRHVSSDGIISTVAGNGEFGFVDEGFSTGIPMYGPRSITVAPDGALFTSENSPRGEIVRRVGSGLPSFDTFDLILPSRDGTELYRFDRYGQHLETVSSLTGVALYLFGYDSAGLLANIQDGDGNRVEIMRDTDGVPLSIVAPGGQVSPLEVNAEGYLERITNPAGEAIVLAYGDGGLLTAVTDPRGNTSNYQFDVFDLLILAEDPAGGSKTFDRVYDETGYTVTMTTAMGLATTYRIEVSPSGDRLSIIQDPDGSRKAIVLGADGQVTTTHADGNLVTLTQGPDPRFSMLSPLVETLTVTTPGGLSATTTQSRSVSLSNPDDILSVISIQDTTSINGRSYTATYNSAARSYTSTSPEGRQTVYSIDELGRVIGMNLAVGVDPISKSFDALGRLTQISQGTQFESFTYRADHLLESQVNAAGHTYGYDYDAADRLTDVSLPDGESLTYAYDENGNRTALTMPSLDVHAMEFTTRNQGLSYTPPDGLSLVKSYDLDSRLQSKTLPGGRVIVNGYDAAGRWTSTSYPAATVSYGFDGVSERLVSLSRTPLAGSEQSLTYSYDGSLVTGASWSGAAVGDYAYTYDADFFVSSATLTSGVDSVVRSFTYDADGLVTNNGPFILSRGGPGGSTSEITDANLAMAITYDSLGRISGRSQSIGGTSAYEYSLVRNNAGKITQKIERVAGISHTYDYSYDMKGRLTGVVRDSFTVEGYTYDVNGNRLSTLTETVSHDSQDRLLSHGTVTYAFDDDGFLTQRGSDSFVYSALGELLSMATASESVSYAYDGLRRRVSRSDSSGVTQYLYGSLANPFLVTAVRDSADVLTTLYYDDSELLFALERGGATYYVATDQVGTSHVVTDEAGVLIKTLEYDSFGFLLTDSNPAFELPIGFAGGLTDPVTGLVHFGYRDLDQLSGQWTARDPVLFGGGQANLYQYVGNDPVAQRDPLGLWCLGGSFYAGGGAGATVCCNSGGDCSLCTEGGAGLGGSLDIGPGEPADDRGIELMGEIGAECGPVGATFLACTFGECGLDCDSKYNVGPFEVSAKGGLKGFADLGGAANNLLQNTKGKCGYQGKIGVTSCTRF